MTPRANRTKDEVVASLRAAGVVGCGGAGFPTYAKFSGSAPDHFIVNAAECEPLLGTDRYVMRRHAAEVVSAISEIAHAIGAGRATIALKENYREEIAALEPAIAATDPSVMLHRMRSFYPAGDEQTTIYEVTGRVVPPGGLPPDVSCVVSNVSTLLAARGALDGRPFTRRYLTVSGEVKVPAIVDAPIGTPLADCLAAADGAVPADFRVLVGGPMMGRVASGEELENLCVTKTTSGLIVLPPRSRLEAVQRMSSRQIATRARAACIRCSMCTDLCPRNLLGHPLEPHRVMRALALAGDLDALPIESGVVRAAALCCECGVCELVACPMDLQPRRINAELKKRLAKAGLRYEKGEGQREPSRLRDARKVPTGRAAARAGVRRYDKFKIEACVPLEPTRVVIPFNQHIGVPCAPMVKSGDRVAAGQLIAASPEDRLGSVLHASIAGRVDLVDGAIAITREGGDEG